jgi:hypothetical protein
MDSVGEASLDEEVLLSIYRCRRHANNSGLLFFKMFLHHFWIVSKRYLRLRDFRMP